MCMIMCALEILALVMFIVMPKIKPVVEVLDEEIADRPDLSTSEGKMHSYQLAHSKSFSSSSGSTTKSQRS